MKIARCSLFGVVLLVLAPAAFGQRAAVRQRLSMNSGWQFMKGDPAGTTGQLAYDKIKSLFKTTGNEFAMNANPMKLVLPEGKLDDRVAYLQREFDDRSWRQVNLPHDWGIEGPFDQALSGETGKLPWAGVGWYRKHLTVPAGDRGRQIYLDIDGAMAYASVWLNGRFAGGWPYGYASFRIDLTPYIEFGHDNVIAIRLDNPPESSRWYPGGGIYRNVWLVKTAPIHVGHWGTYITTPEVTSDGTKIDLRVMLENHTADDASVRVSAQVYELASDGQKIEKAAASFSPVVAKVAAGVRSA